MRKKAFGVFVLLSMFIFPGTWIELCGVSSFRQGLDLLRYAFI